MANTEEKQEFNYFDFFKFQVLKTYYENLLAGKK